MTDTECWESEEGGRHEFGYRVSTVSVDGRRHTVYAHRRAYELAYGPIPAGMVVMHTCDNPPCVNPAHLRVGTHADNQRDMHLKKRAWQESVTACPRGHAYAEENLVPSMREKGGRSCLTCSRNRATLQFRLSQQAAKVLGLSWSQYRKQYGTGIKRSLGFINQEGVEA